MVNKCLNCGHKYVAYKAPKLTGKESENELADFIDDLPEEELMKQYDSITEHTNFTDKVVSSALAFRYVKIYKFQEKLIGENKVNLAATIDYYSDRLSDYADDGFQINFQPLVDILDRNPMTKEIISKTFLDLKNSYLNNPTLDGLNEISELVIGKVGVDFILSNINNHTTKTLSLSEDDTISFILQNTLTSYSEQVFIKVVESVVKLNYNTLLKLMSSCLNSDGNEIFITVFNKAAAKVKGLHKVSLLK